MSRILMNEKKRFHITKKQIIVSICALLLIVASIYVLVTQSGYWLVQNDKFNHVKWAVILDGQTSEMERNDYVARLLREGRVDSVMILGRRVFRDKNNADYYIEDFLHLGNFDKTKIFAVRHDDPSTIAEARTIIPWFKARNIDTVLLVTAPPATKRVSNLFKRLSGDKPVFLTVDIDFYMYHPDSWAFNRETRKFWLHEMAAFANSFLDLWGVQELTAADSAYYRPIRSVAEEEAESMVDLQTLIPQVDQRIDSLKKASQADSTASDSAGINSSTGSSK